MPEFVTIGETCAVLVSKNVGRMRYCKEFEVRPGGAESTVAVGVKRLGHSSGWISQLGDDEFGFYLLSLIRGEGVDVSNVNIITGKQTGIIIRERLSSGDARNFYYREGSAFSEMRPECLQERYIASAKLLHITGITPALSRSCMRTIRSSIEIAKKHKTMVIFDPNMRLKLWKAEEAKSILEDLMVIADYILPGLEDLQAIYGKSTTKEDIINHLHGIGCERIIIKLGKDGAMISLPSGNETIAGYPVENPIDFAAGFISWILKNMDLEDAVDLANIVASLSIRLPGNIESLPDWKEVSAFKNGEMFIKR